MMKDSQTNKTRFQRDADYVLFLSIDDTDTDVIYRVRADRGGETWFATAGSIWVTDIEDYELQPVMELLGYDVEEFGPTDISRLLIGYTGEYQWVADEKTIHTQSEREVGQWIATQIAPYDEEVAEQILDDFHLEYCPPP